MSVYPGLLLCFFSLMACINTGVYLVMLLVSSAAAETIKFSYNYSDAIQTARV